MMPRGFLAALLLGLSTVAYAQPVDSEQAVADQLARLSARAKSAFESNRYAEAVALYQQAYQLEPVATLLYNIAYLYDVHLGDRVLARDFYRRYVHAPDAEAAARLKAFERIAAFDAADAREAEGAAAARAAALAPPAVVEAPATNPWSVAVPSDAIEAAPVSAVISDPAAGEEATSNTLSAVVWGVGGVALLTSGISAALVAGTHDDYVAARTPATRADLAERGEGQALLADVSLAIGVAAVAVGVWLWLGEENTATSWLPTTVDGEPGLVFGRAF